MEILETNSLNKSPYAEKGRIVARGLTKIFGQIKAVDNLSFTVEPGSVTGFLGPNGAGKTTTLRMILGLARPDSGSGTIDGVGYSTLFAPVRRVGAVLEANSFHPGRSGRNHLLCLCAAAGIADSRADQVLEMVGLTEAGKFLVSAYSQGMRQRLGLAAAFLGDPQILILDEPANGLDPEGIAWLRSLLKNFAVQQGRTVLISSHILSEVEQVVDRVVIITKGRLVYTGELKGLSTKGTTILVRTPTPQLLISALAPLKTTITIGEEGILNVIGASLEEVGHAAWLKQVELTRLSELATSLEEVFLSLTADLPKEGE